MRMARFLLQRGKGAIERISVVGKRDFEFSSRRSAIPRPTRDEKYDEKYGERFDEKREEKYDEKLN
jgi:hypothetical protein